MDLISNLALGFETAFSPINLLYCFLGVTLGTFIGVLPGIGALAAISMIMPITFYLPPTTALVMLAGIYYGAEYGGSIASILLNLPGTPSSAVTCLDGYPLTQQGRGGVALLITTIASFFGANFGILCLIAFGPMLAAVAMAFHSAEYFSVIVFGLLASATISQGSPLKGIAMVALGVMLGTVGTDVNTGTQRFTLGLAGLFDGIDLVAMAMGVFGLTEVVASVNSPKHDITKKKITMRSMLPTKAEFKSTLGPMFRGSVIGGIMGALPGTGPTVASFISYATEKRIARDPSRFGNGAMEGIAAPEASNNTAVQTAFIPTLTLGIPGTATVALLMGALMIHGITPGPGMINQHPDLFWGLVVSFWIGNIALLILNIPLLGIWVRILSIRYSLLYPTIVCLVCIGVYSINYSTFDVGVVLVFGLIGYALRLLDFPPAPLIIGFILGPLLEEYLRRALLVSRGDYSIFVERPISGMLLGGTLTICVWTMVSSNIRRRRARTKNAEIGAA